MRRTTASWWHSFPAYGDLAGLGPASVLHVPGPLTATMNLFAAVHAAASGIPTCADPADATHVVLTPARLDQALSDTSMRAGQAVVVAGDRLPVPLAERARAAGLVVHHYYGAAELSFVAWGPDGDQLRAFPEVEVRSAEGVLEVRSPYVALSAAVDEAGWAGVGDRGDVLRDGTLRVHGRPDAVTTGGTTVVLADVEEALADVGAVVVGVPHPRLGAVLAAVVAAPPDTAALRARARDRLPSSHRPRYWLHRATLPLTGAGKLDRAALADWVTTTVGRS
ncbi:MAG: o-succinylbenzoate--CoA ligase [Nocardioides sp.]|nr:o-succinylbenzoate--CoA ligase [Nocardioides sp.]